MNPSQQAKQCQCGGKGTHTEPTLAESMASLSLAKTSRRPRCEVYFPDRKIEKRNASTQTDEHVPKGVSRGTQWSSPWSRQPGVGFNDGRPRSLSEQRRRSLSRRRRALARGRGRPQVTQPSLIPRRSRPEKRDPIPPRRVPTPPAFYPEEYGGRSWAEVFGNQMTESKKRRQRRERSIVRQTIARMQKASRENFNRRNGLV